MPLTQAQLDRLNEIHTDVSNSSLTATQKALINDTLNLLLSPGIPNDWLTYFNQSVEYVGGTRPTKPHTPG